MNIVLLSGGSGKRLWPLSNDVRSKQFIKLFKTENNDYLSMVQRVYNQICTVDKDANVTIATSKTQVSSIHNQLGKQVGVCVEPCRRDTFPAIALATAYLHHMKGVSRDEAVIVCPVDPYVNLDYFQAVKRLGELAEAGDANLTLMGIEPTYPSEKYGYIMPTDKNDISKVDSFKEKPDTEKAKEYISQGALWNAGVFAYKLGYMLDKAHELIDFDDYQDLFDKYDTLTKISFDYAVVEKEDNIQVMRFAGQWKDLGTWNTFAEAMEDATIGKVIMNDSCQDVNVINELDIPVLCMGLKNVVVSASAQGILISDKEETDYIKPFVDNMNEDIMFADKSWGSYRVISKGEDSLTIKLSIKAGACLSYHSHNNRDEIWNIVSGQGQVTVDDDSYEVGKGDVVSIKSGSKHMLKADSNMEIIEVQLGKEINVNDKCKFKHD